MCVRMVHCTKHKLSYILYLLYIYLFKSYLPCVGWEQEWMPQEKCANFHILSSRSHLSEFWSFSWQKTEFFNNSVSVYWNIIIQHNNPHTPECLLMSLISNFYCFAFSTTAFLLSLLFQSRSQVVLGKVKSVELVLRIRILKWSSEDFHPLRCAARLGDGGEDLSWVETLAGVVSC